MLPIPPASPLLHELDVVAWDPRGTAAVIDELRTTPPVWVRIGNFFRSSLEVLRALPPGRLVVWKLEHWGEDTAHRLMASTDVDPENYVRELMGLGHRVVAYTFSEVNRRLLRADVPELPELHVVPVALKEPVSGDGRAAVRAALGVGGRELLLGAGGLLTRGKGLDELAVGFLRGELGDDVHLLMSIVLDTDHLTAADMRARWERLAGCAATSRFHVRLGNYGGWRWMSDFYRTVDVVLVNSVSESWGRMVSEPMGIGRPVLVRRARCGSNHVAPGTVLVDDFAQLGAAGLGTATDLARRRAEGLRKHTCARYRIPVVRSEFLSLLRSHTPPSRLAEFDRLVRVPEALAALDDALCH